jgi:hypothetical protein
MALQKEIQLKEILNIQNPEMYKLHLGGLNEDGIHPLDEYIKDISIWKSWNEWRGSKNDWNREYIFSMIDFYPKINTWLFGGIFKVLERKNSSYVIEEVEEYQKFSGRLLLSFERYQGLRGRAFLLEGFIDSITVNQILEYKYSGEVFPGFENINHYFYQLEHIFKIEKSDWKNALSSVKGIYLLTDKINGKSYIGSAYSDGGIWARWNNYINSFHGWNERLITLFDNNGQDYFRENLKFTLLEIHGLYTSKEFIINRESFWKDKLLTRINGYNSN